MTRADLFARATSQPWDIVVIGGGATGAGVAVDAATRGYAVLLLEAHDFGKGTSSRSTKLVHGGVRYLERGDVRLVTEALRERTRLLANAPHLVRVQPFVVPTYRWWEGPYFAAGLTLYDLLAGKSPFGRSKYLNRREVVRRLPTINPAGLRGGILYHDGQFDDARLVIDLIGTAAAHGATCLNYARVVGVRADGVTFTNEETGETFAASARVVVNATGAFCDSVRTLADPAAPPLVTPSQGAHLVFDRSFLPGDAALVVPKTPDGRVLFAIPWHGRTLVGTTDVPVETADAEPRATEAEIDFILETAGRYLAKPPTRADVLSVFAGIRPLVAGGAANTAALSRDHTIRVEGGLLTVTGGKWTTYRNMAEDAVDRAAELAGLPRRACRTARLRIAGGSAQGRSSPGFARGLLHSRLPYTEGDVLRAVRCEMARTLEDVLSRRLRALVLDAAAAVEVAPRVAELMAAELGRDAAWAGEQVRSFTSLASGYRLRRAAP